MSVEAVPPLLPSNHGASREARRAAHEKLVRRMAFALYERRYDAVRRGDPFQTATATGTPPHVLQERDWLLAESLAGQGFDMKVFETPLYTAVGKPLR